MAETTITIVGNLVADPELSWTPAGVAVTNFRVASTPRRFDSRSNSWVDGDALFLSCTAWRQMAENISQTLRKGMRVIVTGRLRQRSYVTKENERRTVIELEVDEVGPSLRYAVGDIRSTARNDSQGGDRRGPRQDYGEGGGRREADYSQGRQWDHAPQAGSYEDDETPFQDDETPFDNPGGGSSYPDGDSTMPPF